MRTTVDLPESLLREAKQRALREGRSLSAVVTDAVRSSFARIIHAELDTVEIVTFDGGGLQPGIDLDDSASLLEAMETSS